MTTPWYIPITIGVSALALFVATKNYRRKSGMLVRGAFTLGSSIDCNDRYIANIVLENLKDRAITVFAIYLRVGFNYFIEIEKFDEKPLVLKSFETYQKEFGPIQFYGINTNRIKLDPLLGDSKIRKRLVLSTADGKYVVPKSINKWHPAADFFQNHLTAIVHPIRTIYKEKHLGSNIKFVVEFIGKNGGVEIIPVRSEDFRLKIFKGFNLTPASLESSAALTAYLNEQLANGSLVCESFEVHDLDGWRERINELYTNKTIEARYIGRFYYHIIGRLLTWYSNRKLRQENAKRLLNQTKQTGT
jgi:hypothetical protein